MEKQKKTIELSRLEKILITMLEISGGIKKNIRFEDLVVSLFKKYPDHFHLKGYQQFPDSESVNNALYHNLKKKGLINYGNKVFSLTDRGLLVAKELKKIISGKVVQKTFRPPKFIEQEIKRIQSLEGFTLFLIGEVNKITDSDFYGYLGVTSRTPKNDFLGRLNAVSDVIKELDKQVNNSLVTKKIPEYHKFLLEKFESIVNQFKPR